MKQQLLCFIIPVFTVFGIDNGRAQSVYQHLGCTFVVMDPKELTRAHLFHLQEVLSSQALIEAGDSSRSYTAQWRGLKELPSDL